MFCADNVLHCIMKNQSGNQYGVTFVQKNLCVQVFDELEWAIMWGIVWN
jgi:hypothetical protein